MNLTSEEKKILLNSINELKNSKDIDISHKFYEIFLANEEVSSLFKNVPLERQKQMFKMSLESIIFFMDKPNQMKIELMDVGIRHKRYGVKKYHVPIFKTSLLEAVKLSFDSSPDDDLVILWGKAIDIIVETISQNLI
jgi:hemoglobin-like flavoprotein